MAPTLGSVLVLAGAASAALVMTLLSRRAIQRSTHREDDVPDPAGLRVAVGWDAAAIGVMVVGGLVAGLVAG